MSIYYRSLSVPIPSTPNQIRKYVIRKFLREKSGNATGANASRYIYIVEHPQDGNRIILKRPARLKYGFDFLIIVENHNFNPRGRYRDYPTHKNIYNDLRKKRRSNKAGYKRLYIVFEKILRCKRITRNEIKKINIKVGLPNDTLIGIIKWFFIEQDIRYWNYSGRNKFMNGIPKPLR